MTVHILHVEDEPDIREVVEVSLGLDPDFETRSCDSGQKALVVAAEWRPDLILLDVMMPVMDGPATLAGLRTNAKTAGIPVVFMTACAQTRELDLFRSLGIAGVIPKPFDPMTLAASVRKFVPRPAQPFDAARDIFLRRINDDAAALTQLQSALAGEMPAVATLARIRVIAHGLAGAGGIFGHPEISEAATALEEELIGEPSGADAIGGARRALDHLLTLVEVARIHQGVPSPSRVYA